MRKVGFKQTEIGLIPEDWNVNLIKEIGEIRGRVGWKGYTKKDLVNNGPYTIGAKHINSNNKLDLSDPTFISYQKFIESPEIMVEKFDLLIVQRGTIGKLVIIEEDIGEATINPSMLILRTNNSILSRFIYYFFNSNNGQKQIFLDTSSTGVPMITQKQVLNFLIPLPPKPEQTTIAQVLSDTDALIDSLKALIAKKQAIKQGAMQELLTGKTRLKDENGKTFEGEWEEKMLGEALTYEQPPKYIVKYDILEEGTTPVLTANKSFILGYTNEEIGIYKNHPVIIFDDFTTLSKYVDFDFKIKSSAIKILKETSGFSLKYIYNLIQIIDFQVGEHKRHYISEYRHLKVKIPKLKEQTAIAQVLSDMDAEIELLEVRLQKTEQLKQGMMQELLTGRTRLDLSRLDYQSEDEVWGMAAEERDGYNRKK